jgi:signal transduction histidine kinase
LRYPLTHFAADFDKLRQNRISIEEDLQTLARPSPVIQTLIAEGVSTYVGVPLMAQTDLIGSLNLAAASPDFFTAERLEIAQEVAGQLAVAIQQARLYEELEAYSERLEQTVAERTAELIEANESLKELDQLKDAFLSTAAHELRTPLTSIQGFSEILLTRELDEARQLHYLDTINKQSTRLAQIIDDLLDLSRLEAGEGLEIKSEPVDLGLLLAETAQPYIETSTKHHFRLEGLTETPPVQGDPFRLEQVIRNLLSNAVKYSPEGGNIQNRWKLPRDWHTG